MLKKAINYKRAVLAVVLLTTFPFCPGSFGQIQEQKAPQKSKPKEAAKKEAADEKGKRDEERTKQVQNIIEGILYDTHSILNPVVRIRIRMQIAEAYWGFQPERAREILSEEFPKIALIAAPQNESDFGRLWSIKDSGKSPMYKGRPIDQVKAQLRREMLAIVSARDSSLARALVAAEKTKANQNDEHAEELDEVLSTANIEALREELLNWLRNCDKTSDTAWAALEYLDGSVNDNAERTFAAFDILVRVLNSPNLDPENKLKNRVYWYAEFHDFRKSLTPWQRRILTGGSR